MPDKNRKFQEFALRSILFRGRHDWYFCYLKTERIAHVLSILALAAPEGALDGLAEKASAVPGDMCRLAAGEFDAPIVLADIFGLLSGVRLASTAGHIHKDNAALLCAEYEHVAERLVQGSHLSPFGPAEFALPQLGAAEPAPAAKLPRPGVSDIKDTQYGKGHSVTDNGRASLILDVLKKQKSASIKALAAVITDCSEKTIQRELGALIAQGLVRKTGERRWSVYSLA